MKFIMIEYTSCVLWIPADSIVTQLTGRINTTGEELKKNPLFVAIIFFIYEEKRFIYEESAQWGGFSEKNQKRIAERSGEKEK